MDQLEKIMRNINDKRPLVHFITNYVTANDCANMCLAYGGSPIMADDLDEAEDIVSKCSALLINIETLNSRTVRSMLSAGRVANSMRKPVVFDPVGSGASSLRNETVRLFLHDLKFSVIKGNISEIKSLFGEFADIKGVDAAVKDLVSDENLDEAILFARELSFLSNAVVVITGPIDIISDGQQTLLCRNGSPVMANICGTGCMLGSVIAGFLGANPDSPMAAAAAATAAMGICGELAYEKTKEQQAGTGTFRSLLIDSMSQLTTEALMQYMKLELR